MRMQAWATAGGGRCRYATGCSGVAMIYVSGTCYLRRGVSRGLKHWEWWGKALMEGEIPKNGYLGWYNVINWFRDAISADHACQFTRNPMGSSLMSQLFWSSLVHHQITFPDLDGEPMSLLQNTTTLALILRISGRVARAAKLSPCRHSVSARIAGWRWWRMELICSFPYIGNNWFRVYLVLRCDTSAPSLKVV